MIYLIHGPDELLRSEALAPLRAALGPAEMAELSTTWFDGRKAAVSEVLHACDALPFLTPKRLVIVEGLIGRLSRRSKGEDGAEASAEEAADSSAAGRERTALLAYLPQLPETTDLALVEPVQLPRADPIVKKIEELARQGSAQIVVCDAPPQAELPAWIVQRAQRKGAAIERAAAQELATYVGRNLRLLDNELEKLIAYRGGQGAITQRDVRLLTPYTQEASVFDLVDAIGRRDGPTALRLLRDLEQGGAAPLYLLSMIVRQFRILLQVGELAAQGMGKDAIAAAIGLHPYPTQKAMQQSRQWRLAELEAVYDRLLATDVAIKTGKLPDDLALELLVIDLCQRAAPTPAR